MPDQSADELQYVSSLAARIPGWSEHGVVRPHMITSLTGGMTNRNFRATLADRSSTENSDVVIRLAGKNTEQLGINRYTELAAATAAAHAGFGAKVVAFLEPEQFLVTEFLHADEVPDLEVGTTIEHVGTILARTHASKPVATEFNCFEIAKQYARVAAQHLVPLPSILTEALRIAERVRAVFAKRHEPLVPAHNDLLNANFLRSRNDEIASSKLWLIDWEYAGMNNRWFDLGNLVTNNHISEAGQIRLLESYLSTPGQKRSATEGALARITLMAVMSDLREAMWGVAQQGLSTIDFDYATYANDHFTRMLTNAASPSFSDALQHAEHD
jgi:thiamine kinase-like enzyme